jgi:hypothetical protein
MVNLNPLRALRAKKILKAVYGTQKPKTDLQYTKKIERILRKRRTANAALARAKNANAPKKTQRELAQKLAKIKRAEAILSIKSIFSKKNK